MKISKRQLTRIIKEVGQTYQRRVSDPGHQRRDSPNGATIVRVEGELSLTDRQQLHLRSILQRGLVREQHGPAE